MNIHMYLHIYVWIYVYIYFCYKIYNWAVIPFLFVLFYTIKVKSIFITNEDFEIF